MLLKVMFRQSRVLFAIILTSLVLVGCTDEVNTPAIGAGIDSWRCGPSISLGEEDLFGRWERFGQDEGTNTLEIFKGGIYKQTVLISGEVQEFTGRWILEQRATGGHYVRLENMRLCEYVNEICALPEGGGGTWRYYDFCENRFLLMEDEVILAVNSDKSLQSMLGATDSFVLMHMRATADSNSGFFVRGIEK